MLWFSVVVSGLNPRQRGHPYPAEARMNGLIMMNFTIDQSLCKHISISKITTYIKQFYLLSTGEYEDQTDKASGRRVAVWKAAQRTWGPVPCQLRGDKGASARRAATAARATRHSPRSLRFRTSSKGRSVLHCRWHHFSHISTQRRMVFRRMQRNQRTIPCQLCSNELIIYYFCCFKARIPYLFLTSYLIWLLGMIHERI